MTRPLSRRRFLTISAAAAVCVDPGAASAESLPEARWSGVALGAGASLRLVGITQQQATPILNSVVEELRRLEQIFSLYRSGSAIARLNRVGYLDQPPADLLKVLSQCDQLHRATQGAFDPTVQPLFALSARAASERRSATRVERDYAQAKVGWEGVVFDANRILLKRQGAELTLNGIAQGYVTDQVAALLRQAGMQNVLIDMGEIAALGRRPGNRAWRAGIADPEGRILKRLTLVDRALATSAPFGTVLDRQGKVGHIFDPRDGHPATARKLVAISADHAALADGLSTALCLCAPEKQTAILRKFPNARLEVSV